jgi:hypothetical protein|nr:MAG TPA: hypothetical protein [Caudoviricetes sp.]
MAEYLTNTTDLTKVASAIREKGGTSDSLVYPDGFVTAIQAIQTGTELQIIVSVTSGATVTATKGSKVVSGTSVNGMCILTVPEEGEWTVSATLGGATSESNIVKVASSYDTTLVFASTTLNDNSWETIRGISDAGRGANFWSIGDRKAVTLNGTVGALTLSNFTTYAFIIGFNHNASVEGANRIHFQLGKTALSGGKTIGLCDPGYNTQNYESGFIMNPRSSNSAGWRDSHMRNNICGTSLMSYAGTMIAVIPEELRAVIKSVAKYTDNASNGSTSSESNITATNDYFFLLGEFEVRGTIDTSTTNQYEARKQAQYAYYAAGNNPSVYRHDKTTEYAAWWLRSRDGDSFRAVVNMNQASYVTYVSSYSATDLALVVGFCV